MNDRQQCAAYSLRIEDELKDKARLEAAKNRRSLNAELGILIEEGLRWREMQKVGQAVA